MDSDKDNTGTALKRQGNTRQEKGRLTRRKQVLHVRALNDDMNFYHVVTDTDKDRDKDNTVTALKRQSDTRQQQGRVSRRKQVLQSREWDGDVDVCLIRTVENEENAETGFEERCDNLVVSSSCQWDGDINVCPMAVNEDEKAESPIKQHSDIFGEQKHIKAALHNFRKKKGLFCDCVCVVCHRLLWRSSVTAIKRDDPLLQVVCENSVVASEKHDQLWVCTICKRHLKAGKVPPQAVVNGLSLSPINHLEPVNDLESHMIAAAIPFMRIVNLPKGAQKGIHGPVVCVPSNVSNIPQVLPRSLDDGSVVKVKLKRKLQYSGHYLYRQVSPPKILAWLQFLLVTHPSYAGVTLSMGNLQSSANELQHMLADNDGVCGPRSSEDCAKTADAAFTGSPLLANALESKNVTATTVESKSCESEETELAQSCLEVIGDAEDDVSGAPETMTVGAHGSLSSQSTDKEGQVNSQPMGDDDDVLEESMELRSSAPLYSCMQPLDIGQHFLDQLSTDTICISPAEGNKPTQALGCESDCFPTKFPDGQHTIDAKRNTRLGIGRYINQRLFNCDNRFASDPTYIFWAQYVKEIAEINNCISIAMRKSSQCTQPVTSDDLCDTENVNNIIRNDDGYQFLKTVRGTPAYWQQAMRDLNAMLRQLGNPTFFASFSAADRRWTEIVQCICSQLGRPYDADMDWSSYCELINENVVTATRMFHHRVDAFLTECLFSENHLIGKVRDYFHRVEFQSRGWPHLHCLIWLDKAPQFEVNTDEEVTHFIDGRITCRLPDKSEEQELYERVTTLQTHSSRHSKSCRKGRNGTTCRYNFPRVPSCRTFIGRPKGASESERKAAKEKLAALWKVFLTYSTANITTEDLFQTTGVTQELLEEVVCTVVTRPTIILRRSIQEIWINGYNPWLLHAWDANIDLQFVLDSYSCIMYIVSYISKAERELGILLTAAQKEARLDGNYDAVKELRHLGQVYINHREVSTMEAVYRATGLPLRRSTRQVVFIPSDPNATRLTLPLKQLKQLGKGSTNIWCTNIVDRYLARPDGLPFDDMSLAEFCANYFVSAKATDASSSQNSEESGPAPQKVTWTLKDGKGSISPRLANQAVIRYPRFREEADPERYYANLLRLFLPHRSGCLKPGNFNTYEDYYHTGLYHEAKDLSVKDVVTQRQTLFSAISEEQLDAAFEDMNEADPGEGWAELAPMAESERTEDCVYKVATDNTPMETGPDLNGCQPKQCMNRPPAYTIESTATPISDALGLRTLQMLNQEQLSLLNHVIRWCHSKASLASVRPLRLCISGGAGTGKSTLIRALQYQIQKIFCDKANIPDSSFLLLCAPTGTAAFNIGGRTIHNALSIPVTLSQYVPLGQDAVNTLRKQYTNLKVLIIDEISIVPTSILDIINQRLNQILRPGSQTATFGNLTVIAFGDFYQLSPVRGSSVLFSDKGSLATPLWEEFTLFTLHQIMRQKDDLTFALLLNTLRTLPKGQEIPPEDDRKLQTRIVTGPVPDQSLLRLYATNVEVDQYNSTMLANFDNQVILQACDMVSTRRGASEAVKSPIAFRPSEGCMLPAVLRLAPGCRIMVIANVDVADGIVNGALGTVKNIYNGSCPYGLPEFLAIDFDNPRVGITRIRLQPTLPGVDPKCVLLGPHQSQKIQRGARSYVRCQYPVKLAFACTIHKVQGATLKGAVVDLAKVRCAGQAYVALSRSEKLDTLFIENYNAKKIYADDRITPALDSMPTIPSHILSPVTYFANHDTHTHFTYVHLNVQSLPQHYKDLIIQKDLLNALVVLLTETWLTAGSQNYEFPGYHQERYDRPSGHGGGLLYLVKDCVRSYRVSAMTDKYNNQVLTICLPDHGHLLVGVYRPPKTQSSSFQDMAADLMGQAKQHLCHTVVIFGDFNEAINATPGPLHNSFCTAGYEQLVKEPTTRNGSMLDHIYVKTLHQCQAIVIPLHFSYHFSTAALLCTQPGKDLCAGFPQLVPLPNTQLSQLPSETSRHLAATAKQSATTPEAQESSIHQPDIYSTNPCSTKNTATASRGRLGAPMHEQQKYTQKPESEPVVAIEQTKTNPQHTHYLRSMRTVAAAPAGASKGSSLNNAPTPNRADDTLELPELRTNKHKRMKLEQSPKRGTSPSATKSTPTGRRGKTVSSPSTRPSAHFTRLRSMTTVASPATSNHECTIPLTITNSRRSKIIDLWCGNQNVYVLEELLATHGFQQANILLPNVQQGNSCGYIAVCAALAAHLNDNWEIHDYLPALTHHSLVKNYNQILGIDSDAAMFLTDIQMLGILHSLTACPRGVPWLNILPFNNFTACLTRRLGGTRHQGKKFITIVNTTPAIGPYVPHPIGDHWITVIYQL